jgi:hypothetical protein
VYNTRLFRGTDRLKFTASEQDLIRSAEQAQGYRREQLPGSDLARMLVRLLVWTLSAMFLAFVVVAGIGSSYGTLSRALGVLIQGPEAQVSVSPPHLPDRTGYLWLKTRCAEAIKIVTRSLDLPAGEEFRHIVDGLREEPRLGRRIARSEYERLIVERDRVWLAAKDASSDLGEQFERKYREESAAWRT